MPEPLKISMSGVTKRFGRFMALSSVTAEFNSGRITAVLGPNGSGKTTLLKILAGVLVQDDGTIEFSRDFKGEYSRIIKLIAGFVPDIPALYDSLTPMEMFSFIASVRGIPGTDLRDRILKYTDPLGVYDYLDSFIGGLSMGTRQKVSIISALLHDPKILIMDESLNGLDPSSSSWLTDFLLESAHKGKIIIISTHSLELAEAIGNDTIILNNGGVAWDNEARYEKNSWEASGTLKEVYLKITSANDPVRYRHLWQGTYK